MSELKVNDGSGLYDTIGLIDSLITDCNVAVKNLVTGNAISFCSSMVQMVQKLNELKKGIRNEMDSLKNQLEEAKQFNNDLVAKMPVEMYEYEET